MDSNKKKPDEAEEGKEPKEEEQGDQQAPADALSRTPEDLAEETGKNAETPDEEQLGKKASPVKRFFRKVNVYFLLFLLVIAVAGIVVVVTYLNDQKTPSVPNIESQSLTQDALKQLENTNVSIGDSSETLTIRGSAVISGQTLTRGDLNVAGNFQTAGNMRGAQLTISGDSNLGATQAQSLQVANNAAIEGSVTLRDLTVSGSSSFDGPMTASRITVSELIMSGNARLEVPNHISFTGPSPGRSVNAGVLGAGGTASVNGSDTSGTVNINTGNNPRAGCFARISFRQNFSSQPNVIIGPVGAAAGRTQYYANVNTNGFSICTNNAAPANANFGFSYFVTS